jgi:RimJ/RimL family protein N-acetyltransferase
VHPSARELMRLHVEALFTRDDAARLVAVNVPGGAAAPRFFLGRTAEGSAWWFRHDVDAALARDLDALCEALPPGLEEDAGADVAAPFVDRLGRAEPVRRTWSGPAFLVPADLSDDAGVVRVTSDNAAVLSPYLEEWRGDVAEGVPMAVVLEEGKAVSVCCSVRLTPRAHEAGVETHRDFRGRGHAARAVAAWARGVRELERIPLYSTSWENRASRAVARKLGLFRYGVDLHIT